MLLRMVEPALLYTLDKKTKPITVSGNKVCIGNNSLTIVGRWSFHTVGGLGSCLRVWGLGSSSRVQGPARGFRARDPARGSWVRRPV